jgi:SAM-dependent methyltransferase
MDSNHQERPKQFYEAAYSDSGKGSYGGDSTDETWVCRINSQKQITTDWLRRLGVRFEADEPVLELGCGLAYLADVHPGYIGLEFSSTAVARVGGSTSKIRIQQGDMQNIPFEDESIAALFTWAAMEHVPNPGTALKEIMRVLKPGGGAIVAPAWHCRPWTVKKLEIRPYSELRIFEKMEKALIPIRGNLAWRTVCQIPGRLYREGLLLLGVKVGLSYRTLSPVWELNRRYPHIADDDALASIDMHSAICFFQSRGWLVLSHASALARVTCRSGALVVKKPL